MTWGRAEAAPHEIEVGPEARKGVRHFVEDAGGELATQLLEKWLGQTPYAPDAPLAERLAAWQSWYATTFPGELPARLPKESQPNRWSFDELLSYLESPEGKAGSPTRGKQAFHTAQCVSCHRFNGHGEGIGPDLTAVAQRFQRLGKKRPQNLVVLQQKDGKTHLGQGNIGQIVCRHPYSSVPPRGWILNFSLKNTG